MKTNYNKINKKGLVLGTIAGIILTIASCLYKGNMTLVFIGMTCFFMMLDIVTKTYIEDMIIEFGSANEDTIKRSYKIPFIFKVMSPVVNGVVGIMISSILFRFAKIYFVNDIVFNIITCGLITFIILFICTEESFSRIMYEKLFTLIYPPAMFMGAFSVFVYGQPDFKMVSIGFILGVLLGIIILKIFTDLSVD